MTPTWPPPFQGEELANALRCCVDPPDSGGREHNEPLPLKGGGRVGVT